MENLALRSPRGPGLAVWTWEDGEELEWDQFLNRLAKQLEDLARKESDSENLLEREWFDQIGGSLHLTQRGVVSAVDSPKFQEWIADRHDLRPEDFPRIFRRSGCFQPSELIGWLGFHIHRRSPTFTARNILALPVSRKIASSSSRIRSGIPFQLCEQWPDHAGTGNFGVGQELQTAAVFVGQPCVIDAELREDGGVQVGDTHTVLDRRVAEFVRPPVGVPFLESTTCQKQAEGMPVMIATVGAFGDWKPAELAGPHHDGLIQ